MSVTTATQSIQSAEKRAKRIWLALVVFLFVIQGTIMGLVMHLAIGDPASAVVPDYHNAALNWDDARRRHEAAKRLGLTVEFGASDVVDGRGLRAITLDVHDSTGSGVDHLQIAGRLYHHAHANEVLDVKLDATADGRYVALVPAERAGLWQLELALDGADEPIAESVTFEVAAH